MRIMIFAYLDNNFGDDLMLKLLSESFIDIEFYVYTSNSVIANSLKKYQNFVLRHPTQRYSDIDAVDGVLSVGGSIFVDLNSISGKILRLKKLFILAVARMRGKFIATIGCNLGPYNDKLGVLLTKIELSFNSLVTVRDGFSYDLLKRLSIQSSYLADDIVYGLSIPNSANVRFGLGISAYRSLGAGEVNDENYRALAAIADAYVEQQNAPVKIFAFDSESENDLAAAFHIVNYMKNKDMAKIIPYLGDIDSFQLEFASCELHIAIRFHAAVLADLLGIPFFPISYSNKMKNLISAEYPDHNVLSLADLIMARSQEIARALVNPGQLCPGRTNKSPSSSVHFELLGRLLAKNVSVK